MAKDELMDGCLLTARCGEILARLLDELLELTGKVDASKIYIWQQEIRALLAEMPLIANKQFLETRSGAQMAHLAFKKVGELAEMVKRGASALPPEDAGRTVGKAMRDMTREVKALIELALSRSSDRGLELAKRADRDPQGKDYLTTNSPRYIV